MKTEQYIFKLLYESGRDEFSRVKLSWQRSGGNEDCSGRFDYRGFELPRLQLQKMCDRNPGRIDRGSSHREVRIFRVNFICTNKKKRRGSSARYQDWYAFKLPRNFFTPFEIEYYIPRWSKKSFMLFPSKTGWISLKCCVITIQQCSLEHWYLPW